LDAVDNKIKEMGTSSVPAQDRHFKYAKERAMNQLHAKSKAMYSMKVYREPILEILKFPGLRRSFKAQSMDIFLRGRTTEVNNKAACTQLFLNYTN
jgi:hypothetical protein